jgi:predicted flap endonuclease-1-like 5' DNA nuclease
MAKKPTDATHPNATAFPPIGGPALRALATAGIRSLSALAHWSERDLLQLHGMGPKGVRLLKEALVKQGRQLRASERGASAR